MITVAFLCAHLAGGWGCIPFDTLINCLAAEQHMPIQIVTESSCENIEVFPPANAPAPELAPISIVRPS